jgi:hypothetical protein
VQIAQYWEHGGANGYMAIEGDRLVAILGLKNHIVFILDEGDRPVAPTVHN